jgi:1-acyl-sn-glycerol-3-phosphate acyltransferase
MASLRAFTLIAIFVLLTCLLMPWQAFSLRFQLRNRKSFPQRYHRFLCRLFGIKIRLIGTPVTGEGLLIVANHTSYFDILIFSAVARVSFVAKAEVATWPFFSTLAKLQETVFVERTRRAQTREARDQIRERLLKGDTLVLFPEGTSNDGNKVLAFKSALMGAVEAAVGEDAQGHVRHVRVQPVSTAYVGLYGMPMGRENRPLYAWYGDMELVPHLWEAVKTGPFEVVVEFHQPMSVDTVGSRKALAAAAETVIRRGQARALAGLVDSPEAVPIREASGEARELAEATA